MIVKIKIDGEVLEFDAESIEIRPTTNDALKVQVPYEGVILISDQH
jgi:hypothetical protein